MRSKRKDEDLKMDEASIVNAIQADLQNYKVKTQIRRKESQLHVLVTRAEGDDVDYASLYDIVKRRIDKLPIEGADSLVVYGRLSGAKHPEWQRTAEIKPPLPLIELDLDELEEFDDIGAIGVSPSSLSVKSDIDETEIQEDAFESEIHDDLRSFKNSIDNDLKISTKHNIREVSRDEISNTKTDDFDLDHLELQAFNLDGLQQDTFDLDSLESDPFEASIQALNQRSPLDKKNSNKGRDRDEDFSFDSPTVVAIPMPLPPPPTVKRTTPKKPVTSAETQSEPIKTASPKNKSLLFSGAFAVVAIGIVGICGWLVWDRSNQQQFLANARNFSNQDIDPKKITKLETLTGTRNRLQTIILK